MLSDKNKIQKKKPLQKFKTSAIAIGKQRHVLASFPKCQAVPGKMCVTIVNRWLPVKTTWTLRGETKPDFGGAEREPLQNSDTSTLSGEILLWKYDESSTCCSIYSHCTKISEGLIWTQSVNVDFKVKLRCTCFFIYFSQIAISWHRTSHIVGFVRTVAGNQWMF